MGSALLCTRAGSVCNTKKVTLNGERKYPCCLMQVLQQAGLDWRGKLT